MERDPALHALAATLRRWARSKLHLGLHCTLSAYSWTLIAVYALQQAASLPLVGASSADFAALVDAAMTDDGAADADAARTAGSAWRRAAAASLRAPAVGDAVGDVGIEARMRDARLRSPPAAPQAADPCDAPSPGGAGGPAAVGAEGLGLLLWHVFMLLATDFPYRRRVVSLRDPTVRKQDKGWIRKDEGALMLEDPIETGRDL